MKYDKDLLSVGGRYANSWFFGDRLDTGWDWKFPPDYAYGYAWGARLGKSIFCGTYWVSRDEGGTWQHPWDAGEPYPPGYGYPSGLQVADTPFKGLLAFHWSAFGNEIYSSPWPGVESYPAPGGYGFLLATDGIIHGIKQTSEGVFYRRSEDYGETWTAEVLALQNPPEGLGGISVHGVGNKVVVAAIGSAQMHTYIAGEDTLQGVLWFPCAVQVEVWYGQSDLFSAVSLDGGATWSDTKQYSRPFFGGLSNIGETRWTIIEEGEYYGLKSPGYGTYYGGYQEPSGFALGSVGDTIWAVLPCYSIFLSTERVYVGRPHGLQYNYLGPAQTPCLLFLSSADWSGEFTGANVITTGAVSKGNYAQDNIANQLRARVNANGDKCYILTTYQADDTRLFEVFANGVCKNEEILDVSDTILFLPNFWVRYMPSAGYSFWW